MPADPRLLESLSTQRFAPEDAVFRVALINSRNLVALERFRHLALNPSTYAPGLSQAEVDDLEERARAAITRAGHYLLVLRRPTPWSEVLESYRTDHPGFGDESYRIAILSQIDLVVSERDHRLRLRAERIAEARKLPLLDAVFELQYYNMYWGARSRFNPSTGGIGDDPIVESLEDLHPRQAIREAIARAQTLIVEGRNLGLGYGEQQFAAFIDANPGFGSNAYSTAVIWIGYPG